MKHMPYPGSDLNQEEFDLLLSYIINGVAYDGNNLSLTNVIKSLEEKGYIVPVIIGANDGFHAATEKAGQFYCKQFNASDLRTASRKHAELDHGPLVEVGGILRRLIDVDPMMSTEEIKRYS